jgi:hypothetical protein
VDNFRTLIEDCCGWNRKTWADALEFAIAQLPERLDGLKVLEIGAGKESSISPIFASRGADVLCSYHGVSRNDVESGSLYTIVKKYGLNRIPVEEQDIYNIQGTYDVVVMKGVLGAVLRYEKNCEKLKVVIDTLLKLNVRKGGYIISIESGYLPIFTPLKNRWGAGKNGCAYPSRNELLALLTGFNININVEGFGFINFGQIRLFRRRIELINDILYLIDKIVLSLIHPQDRAVLAIIMRKI